MCSYSTFLSFLCRGGYHFRNMIVNGLFNNALKLRLPLNGRMMVNNELERMWKEAVKT